ncbi:MAG: CRTAC1 family protein [Planctomycetes bacterium]|nr:CRTAC1 family protein [Planctomycetota bacterium]
MSSRVGGLAAIVVIAALWLAGLGWWAYRETAPAEAPAPRKPSAPSKDDAAPPGDTPAAMPPAAPGKTGSQRYEDLFKNEIAAQTHEDVFVKLWDAVRAAPAGRKHLPLRDFAFTQLRAPAFQPAKALEHGIAEAVLGPNAEELGPEAWRGLVDAWIAQGYELAECEFHHPAFDAAAGGGFQSTVNFLLHLANAKTNERLVVKGELSVRWQLQAPDAAPSAGVVEVASATLLRRTGAPVFREVHAVGGEGSFIQPLLAHDLDGDGRDDVLMPSQNAALLNRGGMKFEERPLFKHEPGFLIRAAAIADFDGDGHDDLLAAGPPGLPALFPGDGKGGFSEAGRPAGGVAEPLVNPLVLATGDVDGDGDLDVWLTQYRQPNREQDLPKVYFDANDGYPSYLLLNDGKGTFSEGTQGAGLAAKRLRRTFSASFVDLDDDGDLDLVVVSDFAGVDLYTNDGKGYFREVSREILEERSNFGMSHALSDFDNDGKLDLYVIGMSSTTARRLERMGVGRAEYPEYQKLRPLMGYGNRMYLGQGGLAFRQPEFRGSVARTGWSWGTVAFDFDNDGDRDLYVANGFSSGASAKDYCTQFWSHDIYPKKLATEVMDFGGFRKSMEEGRISWNGFEHNNLLQNLGGREFCNTAWLFGVAFEFDSRLVLDEDLDGDGRRDLLLTEQLRNGTRLRVYRNEFPEAGRWIGARLLTPAPGATPIGARVSVSAGGKVQVLRCVQGDGLAIQHSRTKHFGLGAAEQVDWLEVRWPDGKVQRLDAPAAGQVHVFNCTKAK